MRLLTILSLLCVATTSSAQHPLVGINLEGNDYYSEEYAFTDMSHSIRELFAQKNGAPWAQADPGSLTLGADGYPTFIASGHSARTLWDTPKGHAGGQHVLLWDGTGDIAMILTSGSDIISTAPGRIVFNLPVASNTKSRRGFEIQTTDVSDPVHNIRIVPIGQEAAYTGGAPSNPFRSVFLDRWSNMGAFRFMDWGKTNDSTLSAWGDRPLPGDITQTTDHGIALELQIAQANESQKHPWFTVPHLATDDYVQNMATLIRDNLDAGLSARIEFSNEVWNSQFDQTQYAISQGPSIGENADGLGGLRWYSHRSVQVFDIFEDVFTNSGANPQEMDRLVRVLAAQAANDWAGNKILEYNDAYLKADALAIAPYFGSVPVAGTSADAWTNATWAERITMVEQDLQTAMTRMEDYANLLSDTVDGQNNPIYSDIKLFAYEGGQHYVGSTNTHADAALTQLMQDLSGRPEMREWYFEYLSHWDKIGGEDFMLFSSMGERSKWGSWGHLEYEGQPLSESPKMQGILDYLASISGDYDLSGTIDAADYAYWVLKLGTDDIQADGNNDGIVDAADYTIWRDGYEAAQASSLANSLPEPGTLAMLMSLIPWLFGRRQRAFAVAGSRRYRGK